MDAERERIAGDPAAPGAAALSRRTPTSSKVRDLWGDEATPARLAEAADDVRFQLGQSDRFRAGLMRAGAWEAHIAEVLANLGLPARDRRAAARRVLVRSLRLLEGRCCRPVAVHALHRPALPAHRCCGRRAHGSVSRNRSRGAAAELQLPAAGQLAAGDHRLQPRRRGHACARANSSAPTTSCASCATITVPTFGFASRNFYVSFLAALTVVAGSREVFRRLRPRRRVAVSSK